MLFKTFKPMSAIRNYRFVDPDTQRAFSGSSVQDLVTQVEGYRKANELDELEYLGAVITNYICNLPENRGQCAPIKSPKISVVQFLRGGVAILKNIAYRDFVDQDTADKRSEICSKCPKNDIPDQGPFIEWANSIAVKSVGDRRSNHHDELGVCQGCLCPLRGKCWYKGKIKLTKEQYDEMAAVKEVACWQVPLAEISER